VSSIARLDAPDTATLLRRGLVVLAFLGMAGAAAELAFTKHWLTVGMAIAWADIGVCLVAAVILAIASSSRAVRSRRAILTARWLSVAGLVLAVVGVVLHVWANLQAGPADPTLGAAWATIPPLEQLWDAVTGTVGKAPSLAPGALAETSLILLLATIRHPALDARAG
jgi:predicted membrane channel-forming protein YqfA (hemolysin III family)